MSQANLLILVAVTLPPRSLNALGEVTDERTVETPFGPVGPMALRTPGPRPGQDAPASTWVLPYSGLPTRTDPRATIHAAIQLGVAYVLNWDEAVAVNPVLTRGQAAVPVDYIDWTRSLPGTFTATFTGTFTGTAPANPSHFEPPPAFDPTLVARLAALLPHAPGVTYLGVDGPRRETPAEARMFRAWGVDVLGQNLIPEVILAQEMGLAYAGLVTVLDRSADQVAADPHGELREGLEQITAILPQLAQDLQALNSLPGSLQRPKNQFGAFFRG